MLTPRVASVSRSVTGRSQSTVTNRRSSSFFNSSRQSSPYPHSNSVQSRNRSLNRSLQTSQIIDEVPSHVVENFGVPLPVLVTEVLTIQDRISEMSVRLSESGWAWLVCGRRLFIWRFMQSVGPRMLTSQCREVMLPPSDLAHKADLVCVFTAPDTNVPSAIAVSPEGIIRYWPNITHEGSSIETNTELHGQECFSLTNAQPLGCILATTTSTLVLVTPGAVGGQSVIICRQLKVPQGVLTGIGRRMSSFIFGSMPNQSAESKLIKVLVSDTDFEDRKLLFVLTGNNLQKWLLSYQEPDKLLFECDVDRFVKENLIESVWGRELYHINHVQTWLIDMQLTKKGVCILAAGMNPQISPQLYYSFGTLDLPEIDAPTGFSHFTIVKLTENWYQESDEETLLSCQFILSSLNKPTAYMYLDKVVYCMSVTASNEEPDKVEFRSAADRILGAGTFNGVALFFSNNYGIVSLKPSGQLQDSSNLSIIEDELPSNLPENVSFSLSNRDAEIRTDDNKVARLKEAFLLHCKRNQMESQSILEDIFPSSSPNMAEVKAALNWAMACVSKDLIDDYPASDPRWAESVPQESINASLSLIVLHQLEDKQKAHMVYIAFLKEAGLWSRFTTVTEVDRRIPTRLLLCEHAEKLVAAISLRNLHLEYGPLIERAIKIVLQKRDANPKGKLTHQDLFYRKVSEIQDIVSALIYCENNPPSNITNQEIVKTLMSVNTILQTIFQKACQYREAKASIYIISPNEPDTEYLPWMASSGNDGLRNLLIKQYKLSANIVNQGVEDIHMRGTLYQQLVNLADLVLDGYCIQLESISNTGDGEHYRSVMQRYQMDRTELIGPLLEAKQYDRAAVLAEKYCDFGILIQMCEETNNQERLQRYMKQFADKDFSDFVFTWYLKEGKRGKLLSQSTDQYVELQRFLSQHHSLSWLHDIKTRHYGDAQVTLQELAAEEKDNLAKKKTLLSLSKLAALATEEPAETIKSRIYDLNKEQELILHQDTLPATVLEKFGFDPDNMKVMTPAELIGLYICDENIGCNEYDFKKALDLLQYLDKDSSEVNTEALKLRIWCASVLRDKWSEMDMNKPLDSCQETVFFKTIDLIFTEGLDLQEYLPPLNTLLNATELCELNGLSEFRFLIQAGYERIQRLSK